MFEGAFIIIAIIFEEASPPRMASKALHNTCSEIKMYSFPLKLYDVIDAEDKEVIDWLLDGKAFKVKNVVAFREITLLKYFRHNKITSFNKQLNLYGFKRINSGENVGAYYHAEFLRGRRDLAIEIKLVKYIHPSYQAAPVPAPAPAAVATAREEKPQEKQHVPKSLSQKVSQTKFRADVLNFVVDADQVQQAQFTSGVISNEWKNLLDDMDDYSQETPAPVHKDVGSHKRSFAEAGFEVLITEAIPNSPNHMDFLYDLIVSNTAEDADPMSFDEHIFDDLFLLDL